MAQIHDRGTSWELSIFPEITEAVEIIDEPERGYKATLGFDPNSGRHIVSNVVYSKDMYSIEDVMKKIEALRTCERCDTLDKERLQLESINIPTQMPQQSPQPPTTMRHSQIAMTPHQPQPIPTSAPLSKQVGPNIKDMFANVIMDAYLTNPGKYFLGLMLEDDALMQSAYPAREEDTNQFMGDMIDFMSGDMDFMRSPQEAREFLSVMQAGTGKDGKKISPAAKRGLPSSSANIVIY